MKWSTELPYSSQCGVRVDFTSGEIEFLVGDGIDILHCQN